MVLAPPPAPVLPRQAARPRWALPVLLTAAFVTTLDFFVANVALPAIRADLGAGAGAAQLVIAGYGLAYAAGVIVAGRLGEVAGAVRVFVAGLALFTLASLACGLAPSPVVLVVARVIQGSAAALMAPQVLALLHALYRGPDRDRAFAWYGGAVGLAGVSGQLVGGLLIASDPGGLGWRACFLVNLPIGLAALVLARTLPRAVRAAGRAEGAEGTRGREPRPRVDPVSAAMVAAGLLALVVPLAYGREQGWPAWSWLCLAASIPLLKAFADRQRRISQPLLDLTIFRSPGFARGLVAVVLLFGSSSGLSFVLALHLQEHRGLGPMASGAVFTSLNAGFLVASLLARRCAARLSAAGAPALAAGFALVALALDDPVTHLVPGLFLAGAGMGLTMSPLLNKALATVSPARSGTAAGVLGTVQELGGVLGVTVTGLVYFEGSVHAGLALLVAAALGLAYANGAAPKRAAP
ncbi:MFS transporter [Thermoactinospora rubra]|uniref:MFS transporter n=1 Tax=Thermoactinospora rubra TaxID=1088767 RepID=UPI000A0F58C4|nr:MFS transporter [Thermoactinospora rubra]